MRQQEIRSLAELCLVRARTHATDPIAADGDGQLTYADLAGRAAAVAEMLARQGVETGDRVAVQGRNSTTWVVATFGALLAGAVVVPVGHGASAAERDRVLSPLRPAVLLHDDDLPPVGGVTSVPFGRLAALEPIVATDTLPGARIGGDAPAIVLSSSGTTGAVKSVSMTHGQLMRMYDDVARDLGIVASDRVLVAVPLAHSFGFNGLLLVAMLSGACTRMVPSYDRTTVATIVRDEGLTVLAGPPTTYHDLAGADVGSAPRLAIVGGQTVCMSELTRVAHSIGVDEVRIGYGMTETCGTVALGRLSLDRDEVAPSMTPMPGVEVQVRDEQGRSTTGHPGRILVRGYNLTMPCVDAPELAPGGWFDTGDLGVLDADSRLMVLGRSSDIVIVSGFNVHPREIEAVLATHPDVDQVAVVGIPDPRQGERLVACIVPRRLAPDLAALDELAHARLSAYKAPTDYLVLDELPTTATGKLARAALRDLVEQSTVTR